MATIKVDYNKAQRQAKQLSNLATKCTELNSSINRAISQLESNWQGSAADRFMDLFVGWRNENKKISTELNALSADINRIVNALQKADKAVAEAMV